jgi:RIO kinase 1
MRAAPCPARLLRALFAEVRRNIELMLSQAIVHGDLSAYNILYWDADPAATARNRIALIDFPQVVNVYVNRQARQILARDILRICEYFQRQGVVCDPDAILADLWGRYGVEQPLPDELLISEEETI